MAESNNVLAIVIAVTCLLLAGSALVFVGLSLPPPFSDDLELSLRSHPIPSSTCEKLECPQYDVVHEESDFQVRYYHSSKWAETRPINEISFKKAVYDGFRRLFDYIQGKNKDGATIPMTAPVVTTIKPSAGPFCASAFTVRFLVPSPFVQKTPRPDESLQLEILELQPRCVVVRTFSGFTSDFNVAEEAAALSLSLQGTAWENVTSVDGEAYSVAEYNSPFELFNRVNEIWVPFRENASSGTSCRSTQVMRAFV